VTRIDVDFNAVGRDGLVKISKRRADSDFAVGDRVELYDASEPSMLFDAVVAELDADGRGLARVEWEDAMPRPGAGRSSLYVAVRASADPS